MAAAKAKADKVKNTKPRQGKPRPDPKGRARPEKRKGCAAR